MFRPLEAIIRSRIGYPGEEDGFGWLVAINCLAIRVLYLILITISLLCSTYIHSYSVNLNRYEIYCGVR